MKTLFTGLAVALALTVSAQNDEKTDGDFHLDKEYKLDGNGVIDLSVSDAKVYITGSNRKSVRVKIDREIKTRGINFGHEEFSIDVNGSGGDLRIKEHSYSRNVGIIGYYYERYEVNLEVPEGASLVVNGDDGDYFIKNVNGSIAVDVDDADVELLSCDGTRFKFTLDDGDLSMDRGKGSLDVETDDGDVNIRNASFTKVIANIDDGDLEIETSLANDGEYRVYAQDGLVSLTILNGGGEFNIRHDDGRIIADSGFEVRERSETFTKVVLKDGSAKVDIRADDARVRLYRN